MYNNCSRCLGDQGLLFALIIDRPGSPPLPYLYLRPPLPLPVERCVWKSATSVAPHATQDTVLPLCATMGNSSVFVEASVTRTLR